MKILFVVNEAKFFLSHRLPIAEEASSRGYEVMVACGEGTGEQKLVALNIKYRTLPLSRSDINPMEELRTFRTLLKIYREERPDLVHHITIKPVLYGTAAARWSKVPAVVNAVPGMGFIFTRRGQIAALRRSFVNLGYRIALSHSNMRVIFQNIEDMRGFLGHAIIGRHQAALIRGAGVDLNLFRSTPEPAGHITFVLVARMLRDKGLPNALLEGAASGRAMIASDIPGCREVVRDEVTGITVPPRDAKALAQAMLRLGEDPPLRARFGRSARQKAEAVFSVEDVVRHTFLVYEELLAT